MSPGIIQGTSIQSWSRTNLGSVKGWSTVSSRWVQGWFRIHQFRVGTKLVQGWSRVGTVTGQGHSRITQGWVQGLFQVCSKPQCVSGLVPPSQTQRQPRISLGSGAARQINNLISKSWLRVFALFSLLVCPHGMLFRAIVENRQTGSDRTVLFHQIRDSKGKSGSRVKGKSVTF